MVITKLNQKTEKPDIFEGETVETRWDLKKIIVGAVILSALGLLGAIAMTGIGKQSPAEDTSTLGVTTQDKPSLPSRGDIERIIQETQRTISSVTAENLTSSQAAIQKVISDLELLQGNKGAKDVICDLVCKK